MLRTLNRNSTTSPSDTDWYQINPNVVGRLVRRVLFGHNHASPSRVYFDKYIPVGVAKVQAPTRSLKHGVACD